MSSFQSGWSRGKGTRRLPGRDGGLGKGKRQSWEHQAIHSVKSPELLSKPTTQIEYITPRCKNLQESVYLFDQEAAKGALKYYVKGGEGSQAYGYRLRILVSKHQVVTATGICERLRPNAHPWIYPDFGFCNWRPIELPIKHVHNSNWLFAVYHESSRERQDKQNYVALLFRNTKRTKFGIRKWFGESVPLWHDTKFWDRLVQEVMENHKLRAQLISEDPELPKLLRRH